MSIAYKIITLFKNVKMEITQIWQKGYKIEITKMTQNSKKWPVTKGASPKDIKMRRAGLTQNYKKWIWQIITKMRIKE